MDLTTMPWGEWIGGAMSGGLLTKAAGWIGARSKSKAYTMGAVDHAVQTAMGLVTDRLERVEAQNEDCERNLRDVRGDLSAAKAEIDRLMSGPVAVAGQRAPE